MNVKKLRNICVIFLKKALNNINIAFMHEVVSPQKDN